MNIKNITTYLFYKFLKKLIINKSPYKKSQDQFVVFSNDLISSEIILNQYYEKNILFFLRNEIFEKYLNKNSTCLDVGANIGNHSIFFSKYFSRVYSFEPNIKSYQLLKINTNKEKNIFTYNLGLSDKEQTLNFMENKKNYGASKIINRNSNNNNNILQIKTNVLDKFIPQNNIENIKYIKIDTEDHDINILKGSKNFFKKNSPFISVELKNYDYNINYNNFELVVLLKEFGYKYFYNILKYKNQNKYKNIILKIINFLIFYKKSESYYIEKVDKFLPIDYEFLFISKNKII